MGQLPDANLRQVRRLVSTLRPQFTIPEDNASVSAGDTLGIAYKNPVLLHHPLGLPDKNCYPYRGCYALLSR